MNKLKESKIENQETVVEKKKQPVNPASEFVKILNGGFFTKEKVIGLLPFMLFLSLLAILYITNTYYAEKTIRKIDKLHTEIKELKAEAITARSDRMFKSKQSEVAKEAEKNGLKELTEPPFKLVADNK